MIDVDKVMYWWSAAMWAGAVGIVSWGFTMQEEQRMPSLNRLKGHNSHIATGFGQKLLEPHVATIMENLK